ncbi:MAG: NAD-dependent epimerase/dehydratase family protein [Planctomycetota bacterium]|jgi:nucleoside-diphosphate-sugar epimerase
MRVLVTGSSGLVGSRVCADLRSHGHVVIAVDRAIGSDILASLPRDFDAVVHAAALIDDEPDLHDVNVAGTANVLAAARGKRVVFLSSVDVLGVFKGERAPDYLPLDEAHPCYASTNYGRSKVEAEALCRNHDVPTVILRPPGVWKDATYARILAHRARRASFEWDPFWEYGAFIDVRDLASACIAALSCPLDDHATLLVTAPDITTSGSTSRELAEFVHPGVEWRGGPEYESDPFRTLLDIEPARRTLGWEPRQTWQAGAIE